MTQTTILVFGKSPDIVNLPADVQFITYFAGCNPSLDGITAVYILGELNPGEQRDVRTITEKVSRKIACERSDINEQLEDIRGLFSANKLRLPKKTPGPKTTAKKVMIELLEKSPELVGNPAEILTVVREIPSLKNTHIQAIRRNLTTLASKGLIPPIN